MWSSILVDYTSLCQSMYRFWPTVVDFRCFHSDSVWIMEALKNSQKWPKSECIFDRISTAQNTFSRQKMWWICSVNSGPISSWLLMSVRLVAHHTTTQNPLWIARIAGQSAQKISGSKTKKSAPKNDSTRRHFLGLYSESYMTIYASSLQNLSAISIHRESPSVDSQSVKARLICTVRSTHLHPSSQKTNLTTSWVSVPQKIS